jgi:hypothetical protein
MEKTDFIKKILQESTDFKRAQVELEKNVDRKPSMSLVRMP